MAETDDFPEPREPGPDRRDNVASAGLDPDTWEELEAWRTDRRLKRSEATRRLIRAGLDATDENTLRDRLGSAFAIVLLAGYPAAAAANGRANLAYGYVVFLAALVLLEPQLRRLWERFLDLLP